MPPGIGYTRDVDTQQKLKLSKRHKNGEVTELIAEAIGSGDGWAAHVDDEGETMDLGRFGTKNEAKSALKRWGKKHPKGLKGSSGGIPGTTTGIPGMDGNGLF